MIWPDVSPITGELLEASDVFLCMLQAQKSLDLRGTFPSNGKKNYVWFA